MATKKATTPSAMRWCIGSTRFGIEAHDAPTTDFPAQPSQKDGLGRMCKPHWRAYTNGLRKAALQRKAAETSEEPETTTEPTDEPVPAPRRRGGRAKDTAKPEAEPDVAEATAE